MPVSSPSRAELVPLGAADGDIKIGAVLPVTGKESKIGGAYKQATEFAVKEVNDAGGIDVGGKKMKIDLTLLDDTSDAAKSAQLVEQLMAQQKVDAVIGGYGSQLVQAQSVVPERYGIPYVAGGAGARSIYGRSKWVFGTLSPVDVLSQTQMDFLESLVAAGKLKKPLKIALVTENTEHGRDYVQGVKDYIKAHPGTFSVVARGKLRIQQHGGLPADSRHASKPRKPTSSWPTPISRTYIAMHRTYTQMGLCPPDGDVRRPRRRRRGAQGSRGRDRLHLRVRLVVGPAALPAGQGVQRQVEGGDGSDPQWYHACAYETVRIARGGAFTKRAP